MYSKRKAFAPHQSPCEYMYTPKGKHLLHSSPCEYKCTPKGKHLLHPKVLANTSVLQKESICSTLKSLRIQMYSKRKAFAPHQSPCEYKCTLKGKHLLHPSPCEYKCTPKGKHLLHPKVLANTSVLQKKSICSTLKSLRIQVYSKRKAFAPFAFRLVYKYIRSHNEFGVEERKQKYFIESEGNNSI